MPAELTAVELKSYVKLEQKRREHQRQADALERRTKQLKDKIIEYVRKCGGSDRTVVKAGHVLSLKTATAQINWKAEFVERLGEEAAGEITIPTRDQLIVEPVAKA